MAEPARLVQAVVHDLLAVGGETSAFFRATASLCGLSPVEAQVVYELAAGPQTGSGLARLAGVQKSNLTAVLDRLEGRSLLSRRVSGSDRRVRQVLLTEAGSQLARDFIDRLVGGAPLAVRLTRDELEVLGGLLAKARAPEVPS